MFFTEFLKHNVIKERSTRPSGAKDCNLLCDDGNQAGRPGMPSGHSSTVAFFAAYYFQQTTNPWIRAALLGYASLVMWSRYDKKCHRPTQIALGAFIGIVMCVLFRT
jgi:membrane-associated phospholipid phosphatase